MDRTISLRSGSRTLEWAAESESNFLLAVQHQKAANALQPQLWEQRNAIADAVRYHLGLCRADVCLVLSPEFWIWGGFNVCVLVEVERAKTKTTTKYVFRCALAHKLAEQQYAGTVDEKVRCEVAGYAWMRKHCSEIRIPRLFGFGLTDSSQFTHIQHLPWYSRWYHSLRQRLHRAFHRPLLSNYVRCGSPASVGCAYLLLEHIGPETGQMLSNTWKQHLHDVERRKRLFSGISRIMLSLSKLPQQRIGSFCFNPADSTVTLTNRPLTCASILFENSGTPRTIQPQQTYETADTFASDMLTLYDNQFLSNPHAVRDAEDTRERLAMCTLLRTVMHHFVPTERRGGPFLLQMTDFHQSNIFVDDDWNVTCLIDLEWMAALPADMLSVPYWLTDCSIDNIVGERYVVFDTARQEFLQTIEEEAQTIQQKHSIDIPKTMSDSWTSKAVWFWASLRSVNAWVFLFEDHILPKFSQTTPMADLVNVSALWRHDIDDVVKKKVEDEDRYQAELRELFEKEGNP